MPDVPIWTDMTVQKATRDGYKMSVYVYRAVRLIVQSASVIPWIVLDKKGEEIVDHDFTLIMQRPNPFFSGQDMMEFLISHLLLAGNALLQPLVVRHRVREIWTVMPDLVQPIPSANISEWLKGWRVTLPNQQIDVPPKQFWHFMQMDPANPYWGTGALAAAARVVDTDNEMQDTQKISMQNRGTPDGVFTFAVPLNQEQFEEASRQVREKYLGKQKRREPWVVGSGAKWEQMGQTVVEMDYIASRLSNLRAIATAFGLDGWWLGDKSASTYNNVAEARRGLYQDTIIPLLEDVKSTLNLKVPSIYGGGITVDYDTSRVVALRGDYSDKVNQAKTLWSLGVPFDQINARLEMGFDEFPGSDKGYLPLNLTVVGDTGTPSTEEEEEEPEKLLLTSPDYKSLNLQTEEAKAAHWKRIDQRRVNWWKVVSQKIEPLYKAEGVAVGKALSAHKAKAMTPRDWEAAYSDDPPHWAVDMDPSLFAQEFIKELEERKLPSVLEIGCGNGRDSIFFARAKLKVTAIDVAPSAIKLAKENAKEAEVPVDFMVANAEELPFNDEEFGSVFSLSVLHASDLMKSIPEVHRVLMPSGVAFIYLYADTQLVDGSREEYTTMEAFTTLVKEVGFSIVDIYSEQEENFDEFGEKHKILVALLEVA